ncbi:hypothetical protein B0T18DRAFT_185382 [Schizothecium vesticola]|uniref:S1-like domain-containing protein n=1 Tax=Schizothecium vesticola TaxID=314040 RepID=A0AA40EQC5_9PEZI|nr:hypothetical protein B0T18DRAFT_185382 [Schizothecium vesticola]
MGKPKRNAVAAAAQESTTPPGELTDSQSVARVVKAEGNSLYTCELPNKKTIIVELEPRFRNTIWIKRGGYVLIDLASMDERPKESRVVGEIVNVVRDEKSWRKQPYWPEQFPKNTYDDDDDDESTVGKMPPSDSEDES